MISYQEIFNKTCYGLDLYSHVILLGCKVEEGLRVTFPDCGLWPNPFDEYRRSLHITVERVATIREMSIYEARHHDESGHIPDGNAIQFAGLYFNLQNQPLLEKINKDLHLHIGEKYRQYEPRKCNTKVEPPKVSFFRRPIKNNVPHSEITLLQTFQYIVSDRAKETTAKLRSITDEKVAKQFKANNFDYVTPGGTFTSRKAEDLKVASGLIVIDIDDIPSVEEVDDTFNRLLNISCLETQLLFRSPSGNGLKWIIPVVNNDGHTHEYFFKGVVNYLKTIGITADLSGKDICRACFLPHDPNAFINKKYL